MLIVARRNFQSSKVVGRHMALLPANTATADETPKFTIGRRLVSLEGARRASIPITSSDIITQESCKENGIENRIECLRVLGPPQG